MKKTDHNYKKTYEECFCKNVISYFYIEYDGFIKNESPDFINEEKNISLEIRKSSYIEDGKLESLYNNYHEKEYTVIPKKLLNDLGFYEEPKEDGFGYYFQINKKGTKLLYSKEHDLRLIGLIDANHFNDEENIFGIAIEDKIQKLNLNYNVKDINLLGVISNEFINYMVKAVQDAIIDQIIDKIKNAISSYSNKNIYDVIFVQFKDGLLKYDVESSLHDTRIINQEILDELTQKTMNEMNKY